MSRKVKLQRGFKARAEEIANTYREKLGKKSWDPLCAFDLAKYLNIPIYEATDLLLDKDSKDKLAGVGKESCGWSALTMTTQKGNKIIIHNPFHSPARQQSNIMHELSHIICGHSFEESRISNLPIGMRQFNELHEEEAICLGATLQIPRTGLSWCIRNNMNVQQIADHYIASTEMVNYRTRMRGVIKQYSFFRR